MEKGTHMPESPANGQYRNSTHARYAPTASQPYGQAHSARSTGTRYRVSANDSAATHTHVTNARNPQGARRGAASKTVHAGSSRPSSAANTAQRSHATRTGTSNTKRHNATAATPKKKSRYIPALDGLRALAVLGVIAYHMGMAWMPGGLLGVTVFFVLSGYLITSLLLIEWDNTGTINLPQF